MLKICPKCDEKKEVGKFYKDSSKKDGLSSWCRECVKAKSRASYAVDKDRAKAKMRAYRETHQEQISQQKRRWRETNLDHARAKSREWSEKNKNRAKENHRRWRGENKERLRQAHQSWVEENIERHQANQKRWRINNPHAVINYNTRRRAAIGNSIITCEQWRSLMMEYGFKCFYCSETLIAANRSLDHIIPLSRGGRHHVDNLIPCCRSCNSSKKDRIYPVWRGICQLSDVKSRHLLDRMKKAAKHFSLDVEQYTCLNRICQHINDKFVAR